MKDRCCILLLMVFASLMPAGCSDGGRNIEILPSYGTVLLDEKPLQDGMVVLESSKTGFAACAPLDEFGHFSINKIPAGEYVVVVKPPELPPPGETPVPRPSHYGELRLSPKKYHSMMTSGLTLVVGSGKEKDLQIVLTK